MSDLPVDRALLMSRLAGDERLFAQIAQLFLDDCPARLAAVRDAVSRGDAAQIRFAAHTLKGVAANLAASRMMEAAGTLERLGVAGSIDAAAAALAALDVEAAAVMAYFLASLREREASPCAR